MFEANQKVKYSGMVMPATILSGPHASPGADRYLIEKADGNVSLVKFGELTAILSRRETVARMLHGGRWDVLSPATKATYLRTADRVLAALDDMPAEAKPAPLTAGDKIRIIKRNLDGADVCVGDILTVLSVRSVWLTTNAPRSINVGMKWSISASGEGTGWERV